MVTIEGTRMSRVKVQIADSELEEHAIRYIKKCGGLLPHQFVRDGKLFDYYHHEGMVERCEPPTQRQLDTLALIEKLRDLFNNKD